MKPYGVRMNWRPGCICCTLSDYHHYRGVKQSAMVKTSKRAAKKRERQKAKRAIRKELIND
jgi:hypothetical protein